MYRNDPILLYFNDRKAGFFGRLAFFLALFLGTKVAVSALAGTLTSPAIGKDVAFDANTYMLAQAPSWVIGFLARAFPPGTFDRTLELLPIQPAFKTAALSVAQSHAAIPYLRDYVDISLMVLMAVHSALLFRHWTIMSEAPQTMWDEGVINRKMFTAKELRLLIAKYDRKFNDWRIDVACFAVSFAATWGLYAVIARQGLYGSLVPASRDAASWQALAYQAWWGNPAFGLPAVVVQWFVACVIIYYMLRHNVNGVLIVRMLAELLKHDKGSRREDSVLVLRPGHHDGVAGIGTVRRILIYVYSSVLIMALCLFLLLLYVPQGLGYVLAPFFAVFLLANPYYIFIPLHLLHKRMRDQRNDMVDRLRPKLEAVRAQVLAHTLEEGTRLEPLLIERYRVLKEEYELISSMPTLVFSPQRSLIYIALYIVPILLLIDLIMQRM